MTTVDQELAAVENTIRKCAQELGQLNLSNNQLMEGNEKLSIQIKKLQAKIAKKNHMLEQESKDKQIIHHKLVKAEQIKQQLEIRFARDQERKQKQEQRQEYERERIRRQEEYNAQQKKKIENQQKEKEKKQVETKKQKQTIREKVEAQNITSKVAESKSIETPVLKVQTQSENFENAQKGEYQPPALFFEENDQEGSDEQEEDDEEDNSKMLEKMREKLRLEREELEQD